jgi:hypothetical protein
MQRTINGYLAIERSELPLKLESLTIKNIGSTPITKVAMGNYDINAVESFAGAVINPGASTLIFASNLIRSPITGELGKIHLLGNGVVDITFKEPIEVPKYINWVKERNDKRVSIAHHILGEYIYTSVEQIN